MATVLPFILEKWQVLRHILLMNLQSEQIQRIFKEPEGSFFLLGPRGTGKTFWCRTQHPDALFIDLLEPKYARELTAYPERLIDLVEGAIKKSVVIIDEIQKAPSLLEVVHLLIERHKDKKFILTGSSPRKLRRKGTNLLAARALAMHMHPYMACELGKDFSLEKALAIGLVPIIWHNKAPQKALDTYLNLYIQEEIQMEGLARNVGAFARFLEAISFSHSSTLNVSSVAQECMVPRKTVEGFWTVLKDLLLAFELPVFSKRANRRLVVHVKPYFSDAGVFRTLRKTGPLDHPSEIDGLALEGLVAQHLYAWCQYNSSETNLYYWRTQTGTEVDFVVYGAKCFCAIEVKNASTVKKEHLKGLMAFQEDYPEAQCILLYRGSDVLKKSGILCMPCEQFLQQLIPNQALLTAEVL